MIIIYPNAFNPYDEIQHYQQQSTLHGNYGATSIFIGTMRDFNQGNNIKGMLLEHYPKMTEHQLAHIVTEAKQQWSLLDTLIIHRVGQILPNDSLVLIAVWSVHRGDAFDASRFIMEALKSRAPFWKKETLDTQKSRWLTKNSAGYENLGTYTK